MKKPTHFLHRFWAVTNERDEVWPHTVRYSRRQAIKAFNQCTFGDYGTWRQARSKGFKLERVRIGIIK